MKIFSLILIAIIIPLTSFPALVKASPGRSGGDGSNSGAGRFVGDPNVGYKGGTYTGKPVGGGDTGPAIVVKPKPIPEKPKPVVVVLPKECKEPVKECITNHIAGDGAKEPPYRGSCCTKLRHAVPCVCKFLTSKNPKLVKNANGVLGACNYRKPICINMPMPQTCRPEVRHCVNMHMYGASPKPTFRGPCCNKFKTSKRCVTEFLKSPDPKLIEAARGVIKGCQFL